MEVLVSAITITFLIVSSHFQPSSCQNDIKSCLGNGNVRLVGGDTSMEGRVEICKNGTWGSVRYCGQTEVDANVICKQLGYSQSGGTVLEGAFMTTNDQPRNYISCSSTEDRVSDCRTLCKTAKFDCCGTNASLEVRCNNKCNEGSIISVVALGVVAFLLLTMLVVTSTAAVMFGVKLKKSQQKRQYESEPHQYVEQQLGHVQVSETSGGPAYDDPVVLKQKSINGHEEADYINTVKCIAYRKNLSTTAETNISQPQFRTSSSPTEDEYEIMRQLTYRGDT